MSAKRLTPFKRAQRLSRQLLRFREERLGVETGYHLIAGVDEVGRGCLAGPVVAAAAIMPFENVPSWYKRVRDSKMLDPQQREELIPLIYQSAISIGMGVVDSQVIDGRGMTYAVHLAMREALDKLLPQPDYVLIDYLTVPGLKLPQKGVADGDTVCFSIACASIAAKVFRDHLMVRLARTYPGYGFEDNKGYGTRQHYHGLRQLGLCPLHRRLFEPVRNISQLSLDDMLKKSLELEESET